MRIGLVTFLLLLTATVPAAAQLSISINIGSYPDFMAVPGYPVYYAPDIGGNYFFYDGRYWVYQDDNWYSSSWYNGPWESVGPMYVPIYILQVPVRYYRRPPQYFSGWQSDRPPRWNDHWGRDWAQRRQDWDRPRYEENSTPAPLPDYQRKYSGKDYPRAERQKALQQQNYHYRPQNAGVNRDSGKRTDENRSGALQPGIQSQPTRELSESRRSQSQLPAAQPEPQAHRERGNANAGAAARKSSGSDRNPEQRPRNDQSGEADKNQDKDQKRD